MKNYKIWTMFINIKGLEKRHKEHLGWVVKNHLLRHIRYKKGYLALAVIYATNKKTLVKIIDKI